MSMWQLAGYLYSYEYWAGIDINRSDRRAGLGQDGAYDSLTCASSKQDSRMDEKGQMQRQ